MLLDEIKLKFGSSLNPESPLVFKAKAINVFIGPNNSGKSTLLKEIRSHITSEYFSYNNQRPQRQRQQVRQQVQQQLLNVYNENNLLFKILQQITGNREAVIDLQKELKSSLDVNSHLIISLGFNRADLGQANQGIIDVLKQMDPFSLSINMQGQSQKSLANIMLSLVHVFLDGQSRLNILNSQGAGNIFIPTNIMSFLINDKKARDKFDKICFDYFKQKIYFDIFSQMGNINPILSNKAILRDKEFSLLEYRDAFNSNQDAELLSTASDGKKSFLGLIASIIIPDNKIIFIDEPEAFLHPNLAENLGRELAINAKANQKQVFVATHSPRFLMGCIKSGVDINIIRLSYENRMSKAVMLGNDEIKSITTDSLLRSAKTLEGLFYQNVVIVEGDADRVFYEEINERLLQENRGIENCLFINAQNKQTIHRIITPLKKMGIKVAAIVDFDLIKDSGDNWTNIVNVFGLQALSTGLGQTKGELASKRKTKEKIIDFVNRLDDDEKQQKNMIIKTLAENGLFLVPVGELEGWLTSLEASQTDKSSWVIKMFEAMGREGDADYLKPSKEDVWQFIDEISNFFKK